MKELEAAIHEYIDVHHENPKPFAWARTADQVLESMARFAQRASSQTRWTYITNHWDRRLV